MTTQESASLTPRRYEIASIPGDGIGKEVVPAALDALMAVGARYDFAISVTEFPWGCDHFLATGRMMDEDGLERLRDVDSILLGAVGSPEVPDHHSLWGLLIPIRRSFDQFVNVRPIRLLRGVQGPLVHPLSSTDLVIVRENAEGEYSEIGGRLYRGQPEELAVQESVFTRRGVDRIVTYAAKLAAEGSGRLVSATKSNGIIHTMPFWDEICREVCEREGVALELTHVDALAAKLVLDPNSYGVVVASNLFGDILSEIGAAISGSIGIAASGNINPDREFPSMFEPIHGSAPDIAGLGVANPIGALWAAAMMLDHLGESEGSSFLLQAIEDVLDTDGVKTRDIGGTATTSEFMDALMRRLSATPVALAQATEGGAER
ncbi:MAG: putative 3-isopropylmalate dehydrogenase [Rhodoglobus sp.]|nr:putative 3-isopropylmalate dehydrogenase [Rhodoglobus sp.]